jgi:hypothetical protein
MTCRGGDNNEAKMRMRDAPIWPVGLSDAADTAVIMRAHIEDGAMQLKCRY